MNSLVIFLLLLSCMSCIYHHHHHHHHVDAKIGVNYGQLGNNLPSPSHSAHLITKTLQAGLVKLYDANPQILQSLSGTNIQVSIMVPNEQIINVSSTQSFADHWIQTNLLPFYHNTDIRYVLVGNEILSSWQKDLKVWRNLVPAMRRIHNTLKTYNISHRVKVSTTHAVDVLKHSTLPIPPSSGTFRSDILVSVVKPLLQFLNRTKSSFFLDAYPYFLWSSNPKRITLDYALFKRQGKKIYTDPVSKLSYTNLLDQMLDTVIVAMTKLGFPDLKLTIAETGWPTAGDKDQIGANIHNAATYNRNLVRKMSVRPAVGTPARPGVVFDTFIFALFNENQKGGPTTERNWGLFYPNETQVYDIKLSAGKNS